MTWLVFCGVLPTAYSQDLVSIFTISTSNEVISHKDVPFGGLKNKILYVDTLMLNDPFTFDCGRKDSSSVLMHALLRFWNAVILGHEVGMCTLFMPSLLFVHFRVLTTNPYR